MVVVSCCCNRYIWCGIITEVHWTRADSIFIFMSPKLCTSCDIIRVSKESKTIFLIRNIIIGIPVHIIRTHHISQVQLSHKRQICSCIILQSQNTILNPRLCFTAKHKILHIQIRKHIIFFLSQSLRRCNKCCPILYFFLNRCCVISSKHFKCHGFIIYKTTWIHTCCHCIQLAIYYSICFHIWKRRIICTHIKPNCIQTNKLLIGCTS